MNRRWRVCFDSADIERRFSMNWWSRVLFLEVIETAATVETNLIPPQDEHKLFCWLAETKKKSKRRQTSCFRKPQWDNKTLQHTEICWCTRQGHRKWKEPAVVQNLGKNRIKLFPLDFLPGSGGSSAFWEQCIHIRTVPYNNTVQPLSCDSCCLHWGSLRLWNVCLSLDSVGLQLWQVKGPQQRAAAPETALEQGTSPTICCRRNVWIKHQASVHMFSRYCLESSVQTQDSEMCQTVNASPVFLLEGHSGVRSY